MNNNLSQFTFFRVKHNVKFNDAINDVHMILREAHHMNCSERVINKVAEIEKFMCNVSVQMIFTPDPDKYIHEKMLDALDYIKDNFLDNGPLSKHPEMDGYRVLNSVYDRIKEFYFEN